MGNDLGTIGVLMGGPSTERDISLKSGKAVCDVLKTSGVAVVPVDIAADDPQESARRLKDIGIDCAFIALHGRFGEDGQIQQILEELHIPYTGSGVEASKLAMDKIASREAFRRAGLDVPGGFIVDKKEGCGMTVGLKAFIEDGGFPLVVKPAAHGSSIGLSIVDNEDQLFKGMETALRYDNRILVEEYIAGRELTVGILGDKALPIVEIIPKNIFFDYEAKYKTGMTEYLVPAPLDDDIARLVGETAVSAHTALGCYGYSRVDIILSSDFLPHVLEVNTIPGMTATSLLPKAAASAGISFEDLCKRLIVYAYEKAGIRPAV